MVHGEVNIKECHVKMLDLKELQDVPKGHYISRFCSYVSNVLSANAFTFVFHAPLSYLVSVSLVKEAVRQKNH